MTKSGMPIDRKLLGEAMRGRIHSNAWSPIAVNGFCADHSRREKTAAGSALKIENFALGSEWCRIAEGRSRIRALCTVFYGRRLSASSGTRRRDAHQKNELVKVVVERGTMAGIVDPHCKK
jgi:hypothetical protein